MVKKIFIALAILVVAYVASSLIRFMVAEIFGVHIPQLILLFFIGVLAFIFYPRKTMTGGIGASEMSINVQSQKLWPIGLFSTGLAIGLLILFLDLIGGIGIGEISFAIVWWAPAIGISSLLLIAASTARIFQGRPNLREILAIATMGPRKWLWLVILSLTGLLAGLAVWVSGPINITLLRLTSILLGIVLALFGLGLIFAIRAMAVRNNLGLSKMFYMITIWFLVLGFLAFAIGSNVSNEVQKREQAKTQYKFCLKVESVERCQILYGDQLK